MPIDQDLTVKPAEISSPIDQYGKAVSLQNLMTTGALNRQKIAESQAQTQDYQAQVAQRQRDLEDQKTIQQSLLSNNGDWGKTLSQVQGQVAPATLLNVSKAHNMDVQEKAKAGSDQLALENSRYAKIDDWLQGIKSESVPDDQKAIEYSNGLSRFAADPDLGPQINQGKQIGLIPDHYDPQAVDKMHTFVVGHLGTLKEAQTLQETATSKQSAATSAAAQAKDVEELPKIKAEADIAKHKSDFMKSATPEQWDSLVDSAVDSGTHGPLNTRTKALVKSALSMGDINGAQSAIKDASDQIGKTETAVAGAKATAPIKIETAIKEEQGKANANMTDDDYQRAGEQYAISGIMPPMGLGSAGRAKIQHYAQQFARDSGLSPRDLAVAQASFHGDTQSLSKLQSTRDMVVQAETTAGKNLDTFLDTAKKVVDSGSPWINQPLRTVNQKGLGNTDLAAFNAARQVASVEIGKVLSQVSGSGSGVLSDSARKEVEGLMGPDATLKQLVSASNILKSDMSNRHQSLDATLGQVRDRIGSAVNQGATTKVQKWGRDSKGNPVMLNQ